MVEMLQSSMLCQDLESITRRASSHNRIGMLDQGLLLVMNAEALYEPPSSAHCRIDCSWESEMTLLALIPRNKIMFLITMDNLPVIHSPFECCGLSAATRGNLSRREEGQTGGGA